MAQRQEGRHRRAGSGRAGDESTIDLRDGAAGAAARDEEPRRGARVDTEAARVGAGGGTGPEGDHPERVPGGTADRPTQVPARGWWQVVRRAAKEAGTDQVPLLSAGVAFYAFLSIFPAMVAMLLVYGLVADPSDVTRQIGEVSGGLPPGARELLVDQLGSLAASSQQSLGVGLVVAVLLALWSASAGMGNLISAINTAYDEDETRGFVRRKVLSLLLTVAALVVLGVILVLVAVAPAVADALELTGPVRFTVEAVRWVLVVVIMALALAVLYRLAPDRDAPRMRWASIGAGTALVLWIAACVGFSLYVDLFGNYAKTYGALAGVVVLLMWLWLTALAILLGAEVNAEAEQQTERDTTTGPPRPRGERGAFAADTTAGGGNRV